MQVISFKWYVKVCLVTVVINNYRNKTRVNVENDCSSYFDFHTVSVYVWKKKIMAFSYALVEQTKSSIISSLYLVTYVQKCTK